MKRDDVETLAEVEQKMHRTAKGICGLPDLTGP
jgi:hypothetical protein